MRTPDFNPHTTFGPPQGPRRPRPDRRDERGHGHGRGRRGGPRARRGAVRLAALSVIADGPVNGYGLITAFSERTDGRWRPSPGSVYPVLKRLAEDELIEPVDEDATHYGITESGTAYLADRADDVARAWESAKPRSQSHEDLHTSSRKLIRAARQVAEDGTEEQRERATAILDEARRGLYGLLAE